MLNTLAALRAAAEETRLRLVLLLAGGEMTVGELTDCVQQSQPRVSRHLKLLVDAGLLARFQEGTQVFYRLNGTSDQRWILDGLLGADTDTGGNTESASPFDGDALRRADMVARRQAQARQYFETHAANWNRERASFVNAAHVEEILLAVAAPAATDTLLDLGTGTGRILQLFAPYIAVGLGIDQSREMLAIARGALSADSFAHCSVRQGDMYALDTGGILADLVIVHQVLHYAENPAAVLANCAAILHSGGRVVVADYLPHDREDLRTVHAHRRLGFGDQEMQGYGREAGLTPQTFQAVDGDHLSVGIWRFEHHA